MARAPETGDDGSAHRVMLCRLTDPFEARDPLLLEKDAFGRVIPAKELPNCQSAVCTKRMGTVGELELTGGRDDHEAWDGANRAIWNDLDQS